MEFFRTSYQQRCNLPSRILNEALRKTELYENRIAKEPQGRLTMLKSCRRIHHAFKIPALWVGIDRMLRGNILYKIN